MEIESKQCVILVPPCVTRDTSLASTDASQNQLSTVELTINICMTSLMLIMMTKKIGWYQEGGGGVEEEWSAVVTQNCRKNCYCQQINFYVRHLVGTRTCPSTTRFFRVLRLSGIISSPCPPSLPFLTLSEVFDITRNQNLQIRTSPLGLLLNISRTA